MKLKLSILAAFLLIGMLFLINVNGHASASPAPQYTFFPTPTPGPDGRIIYIVQENDSIWRIAAIFNISLEKLYEINKWSSEHTIQPGDEVFLGLGGPSVESPTPGPSPTPPPTTPTATPEPGWGIMCIVLYNDLNGSSTREEDEPFLDGGAISVVERTGKETRTARSDQFEADSVCNWDYDYGWELATGYVLFTDLPEGEYNISVAIPDGYNATTATDQSVKLGAGDQTFLAFGAQANAETEQEEASNNTISDVSPGRSPLMIIAGAFLVLGGIGLAIYALLLRKPG